MQDGQVAGEFVPDREEEDLVDFEYEDSPASDSDAEDNPADAGVMTLNVEESIAVFSISKSVESNEEQKVLIGDLGQGITASTER